MASFEQQLAEVGRNLDAKFAGIDTSLAEGRADIAAIKAAIADLEARVDALEEGAPVEPPIEPTEPSLAVDDVQVGEAAGSAVFTVSLLTPNTARKVGDGSHKFALTPAATTVTVDYTTTGATAVAGSDFTAKSGSLTFQPGETSKTVAVSITNDTTVENVESFSIKLSNAVGATISDDTGVCYITSEDVDTPPPTGNMPTTAGFRALTSNSARANYVADTENWYKANTGPRVPRTPASSNSNVSGTVTAKKFNGMVTVASGVKFIDCEFVSGGSTWGIDAENKNISLDHCVLTGTGGEAAVLGAGNGTIQYNNISGYKDGLKPMGTGYVVTRNYIHDLYSTSGAHNDGLQTHTGPGTITENFIRARDTSEVMVQSFTNSAGDAPRDVKVKDNWCRGSDMPIRVEQECGGVNEVTGNVIYRGTWGYGDFSGADVVRDNVDWVSGAGANSASADEVKALRTKEGRAPVSKGRRK